MSFLSRHVSELKSEEFVLGISTGFKGEAGSRFEGIESTKIAVVAAPASKHWTGFSSIDQSVADASIGESMVGKQFPARCLVTYRRVTATEKRITDGRETNRDVEKLVVVALEYISAVDLVDIKVPATEKKVA